jgi:hypothetical protein
MIGARRWFSNPPGASDQGRGAGGIEAFMPPYGAAKPGQVKQCFKLRRPQLRGGKAAATRPETSLIENRSVNAMTKKLDFDYDWLVIGSGLGGSVSALRLSEKGYRAGVLECGRRVDDPDFAVKTSDAKNYQWMPMLGMKGCSV